MPAVFSLPSRNFYPITFERYGQDAAKDRNYVNDCYELVHNQMQEELNQLVIDTKKFP